MVMESKDLEMETYISESSKTDLGMVKETLNLQTGTPMRVSGEMIFKMVRVF